MSCEQEAQLIKTTLLANLPQNWDGKTCIEEMRSKNATNWRQMEWIGWYFEWRAFSILTEALGGTKGPGYGTTVFDYKRDCVWDFKAHVNNSGKPWAILNDSSAIEACLAEHGSVGFVIANGPAFYNDAKQTFKNWHYELMGSQSKYVKTGIATGRSSRRRKTQFVLGDFYMLRLDAATIAQGQQEKWIKGFQKGMINSNAKPRPGKLQIHLGMVPPHLFL